MKKRNVEQFAIRLMKEVRSFSQGGGTNQEAIAALETVVEFLKAGDDANDRKRPEE